MKNGIKKNGIILSAVAFTLSLVACSNYVQDYEDQYHDLAYADPIVLPPESSPSGNNVVANSSGDNVTSSEVTQSSGDGPSGVDPNSGNSGSDPVNDISSSSADNAIPGSFPEITFLTNCDNFKGVVWYSETEKGNNLFEKVGGGSSQQESFKFSGEGYSVSLNESSAFCIEYKISTSSAQYFYVGREPKYALKVALDENQSAVAFELGATLDNCVYFDKNGEEKKCDEGDGEYAMAYFDYFKAMDAEITKIMVAGFSVESSSSSKAVLSSSETKQSSSSSSNITSSSSSKNVSSSSVKTSSSSSKGNIPVKQGCKNNDGWTILYENGAAKNGYLAKENEKAFLISFDENGTAEKDFSEVDSLCVEYDENQKVDYLLALGNWKNSTDNNSCKNVEPKPSPQTFALKDMKNEKCAEADIEKINYVSFPKDAKVTLITYKGTIKDVPEEDDCSMEGMKNADFTEVKKCFDENISSSSVKGTLLFDAGENGWTSSSDGSWVNSSASAPQVGTVGQNYASLNIDNTNSLLSVEADADGSRIEKYVSFTLDKTDGVDFSNADSLCLEAASTGNIQVKLTFSNKGECSMKTKKNNLVSPQKVCLSKQDFILEPPSDNGCSGLSENPVFSSIDVILSDVNGSSGQSLYIRKIYTTGPVEVWSSSSTNVSE